MEPVVGPSEDLLVCGHDASDGCAEDRYVEAPSRDVLVDPISEMSMEEPQTRSSLDRDIFHLVQTIRGEIHMECPLRWIVPLESGIERGSSGLRDVHEHQAIFTPELAVGSVLPASPDPSIHR